MIRTKRSFFKLLLLLNHGRVAECTAYLDPQASDKASLKYPWQMPEVDIPGISDTLSLTDPMRQALDIIKSVETLPSCVKIATSALMHSCSVLEGSVAHDESDRIRGVDLFIDEEVNIYAVRLAICEITGARLEIPRDCEHFMPTHTVSPREKARGFWQKARAKDFKSPQQHYSEVRPDDVGKCSNSLSRTTQSWTSYSNNKQNAFVLCHGMRSEIEKDQQIHLARILSGVTARTTESLHDAIQRYDKIRFSFEELVEKIPAFHRAVALNEEHMKAIEIFWSELQGRYQDATYVAIKLNEHLSEADAELQGIRHTAYDVAEKVQEIASGVSNSIERHEKSLGVLEAEAQRLANELRVFQTALHDGLTNGVAVATREVSFYSTQLSDLRQEFGLLIAYVNDRMVTTEKGFDQLSEKQLLLHEEFHRQWLVLHNLTETIYHTLDRALPIALELSNIGHSLMGWLSFLQDCTVEVVVIFGRVAAWMTVVFLVFVTSPSWIQFIVRLSAMVGAILAVRMCSIGLLPFSSTFKTGSDLTSSSFPKKFKDLGKAIRFGQNTASVDNIILGLKILAMLGSTLGLFIWGWSRNRPQVVESIDSLHDDEVNRGRYINSPNPTMNRPHLPFNNPIHMAARRQAPWVAPRSSFRTWRA